jgi:hypothetical protein
LKVSVRPSCGHVQKSGGALPRQACDTVKTRSADIKRFKSLTLCGPRFYQRGAFVGGFVLTLLTAPIWFIERAFDLKLS